MFVGCAVSGDATSFELTNTTYPIAGFKAKIPDGVADWMNSKYFWSSTESGEKAYVWFPYMAASPANVKFIAVEKSVIDTIMCCLAF